MIACIETKQGLCVVRLVSRRGLSVKANAYCGNEESAVDGVVQAPDSIAQGQTILGVAQRRNEMIKICPTCCQMITPPSAPASTT